MNRLTIVVIMQCPLYYPTTLSGVKKIIRHDFHVLKLA